MHQGLRIGAALLCAVLPHGQNPVTTIWRPVDHAAEPLPYWWSDVQTAYRILLVGLLGISCVAATTRSYDGDAKVVPPAWRKASVVACAVVAILLILIQVMGTTLVYSRRYIFEPYTAPGLWMTAIAAFLCLAEPTGEGPPEKPGAAKKVPASAAGARKQPPPPTVGAARARQVVKPIF